MLCGCILRPSYTLVVPIYPGRVLLSRRPRFLKEGALFNPGIEASVPGPGSYNADKAYGLGTCKLSGLVDDGCGSLVRDAIVLAQVRKGKSSTLCDKTTKESEVDVDLSYIYLHLQKTKTKI